MKNPVFGYGGQRIVEVATPKHRIMAKGAYPLRAYEQELRESFWRTYLKARENKL